MLKAEAIGRLVADPQLRVIKKNDTEYAVCEFKLACQGRKEEVDFVKVTAWRGMGNFIYNHVQKGQKVYVAGKLKIPPFEKERGSAYEPYIVVFNFEFCDNKKKEVKEQPIPDAGSPSDDDLYETLSEDDLIGL
ncbi:single-stranded DNA-binding protein [Faecalispora jeddahensis]|uniref:single-stranded DNA-binding protein n=1 Tax=Faecalispora jeddahensis TaxID=1414721 RepID=UPI0028AB2A7E|nr:single-stranded DNA-binding protein [Faecalispora jeddahensis]